MLSQMVGAEEETVFPIDKALLAPLKDGTTVHAFLLVFFKKFLVSFIFSLECFRQPSYLI